MKNIKGVTLVALVITIIVLLILAGTTLALVVGNNGIVEKAKEATKLSNRATLGEKVELALFEAEMEKYKSGGKTLAQILAEQNILGTVELSDGSKYLVTENGEILDVNDVPEPNYDDWVLSGTTIKEYNGSDTNLVIPSHINGNPVKSLSSRLADGGYPWSFIKNRTSVITITVPEGVEIIGEFSLYGCNSLTTVNLPSTLKTIEARSFPHSSTLTTININNSAGSVTIDPSSQILPSTTINYLK